MTTPMIPALGRDDFDDFLEVRDEDAGDAATAQDPDDPTGSGAAAGDDMTGPIPGGGELLEEPSDAKVFKSVDRGVESQKRLARNREEAGKHWDRVKRGVPFSFLEKSEDRSMWEAKLGPGVEDTQQPIPNKVLDLSNKQVSQILVDPPLPKPKPDGDSERNRGAMDLSGRFLRGDGDVSGTNDSELFREALTLNRTRASSFVYAWIDKTAGGWRPKQKQAHPQATDPKNPMMGPVLDPTTKQPVLDAQGQPTLERTADPVLRYVGEEEDPETGETREVFVQHAAEAARQWLPKHRRMLLNQNQVRTFPRTATVFDAAKMTVLMWEPLSEARRRFPCLATMGQAELKALTEWKPKRWKAIVPEAQWPSSDGEGTGTVTDETLLFWYLHFCRIGPAYPDGAEIAVNGASLAGKEKGFVLLRDTLREDVETDTGEVVPVLMDPPVAQFRSLIDADCGDPFGAPPVSMYGGANEIRAHLYLMVLEDIDIRLHPNTYLTSDSTVTREDMNRRDGTPLEVLTKDHMPIFEQRPALPAHLPETLERVEHEMDTLANLNQTAQALDSSYSQSGEAKKVALRQAKVQLAQDWQGFINGCLQYWKIKLQLAQARLKTPQLVKISGANSAFKARHFVGADLLGVAATSLMPGTGTMMSPAEKMQYLSTAQGQKWLKDQEAADLFRSSMSDDLGLEPSPHEEQIDRCIADFMEGPPSGWEASKQAVAQFPQQQQAYQQQFQAILARLQEQGMDPQTAQVHAQGIAGAAPTPPPPPFDPFTPLPNDEEPVVASIHYAKMSRFVSTTEYSEHPEAWKALAAAKYERAAAAAGIVTVKQQQQAQQAAQAAAQQAEAAKQQPTKDPNAPPTYEAFIAAATKSVITKAQVLLVKEVEAMGESTSLAQKPLPAIIPDETGAGDAPAAPEPTHPLDLLHQSAEAAKDRAHDLTMARVGHEHAIAENLAKATNKAAEASGQPRPERPL